MSLETVYQSEGRFLEHLQIQAGNIDQYAAEVGATSDDIHAIKNDAENFEFLIETCNAIDESKKTAFAIKARFFSAKEDPPAGDFAGFPDTTPPHGIDAGAIKRHRELDQRFLRAVGITQAAKVALDLEGEQKDAPNPGTVKPTLKTEAAATGGIFSVVVGNREEADQFEVLVAVAGTTDWHSLGSYTGKSADVHYNISDGQPVQLQVRVQLRKSNANYGQPSDIVMTTVNP